METQNELSTKVDLFPLFCRVNIEKTLDEILQTLKSNTKYLKIIVSREEAESVHYHIFILTNEESKKNRKQNLKNFLKRSWNLEGNGSYAITETKTGTEDTIAAYVVKEGNFVSHGFSEAEIQKFQRMSFRKFEKKTFSNEIKKLQMDYLSNNESISWYSDRYIELKYSYAQNVPFAITQTHFETMLARKDERYRNLIKESHRNEMKRRMEFIGYF